VYGRNAASFEQHPWAMRPRQLSGSTWRDLSGLCPT
jgi:hypothetical protein